MSQTGNGNRQLVWWVCLLLVCVGGCASSQRSARAQSHLSHPAAPAAHAASPAPSPAPARLAAVQPAPAASSARPAQPSKGTMLMEVTAYCPCKKCCGPNARGITASGQSVSYHHQTFVSADTRVLPFYTWLVIPGYNNGQPVPVIDRGSSRTGNRLDVFFPSHAQALRWGRQTLEVTIVSNPAKR